ncbi:MAG: LysR family transcriptional regulator, partial [Coriobacteriales bacterium]|nr:LysR family transcriptional regulator [Coriobacteriales bacterium]
MRISYLQEFTDLATSLSFTKVAAARHLSRSSLSKHIATLEEQLGCQLFLRDTNNVELTPDGRVFYEAISPSLSELDEAITTFKSRRGRRAESYTVGVCVSDSTLRRRLADFKTSYEKMNHGSLVFKSVVEKDYLSTLENGSVDALLVYATKKVTERGFTAVPLFRTPMVAIVTGKKPLAKRECFSIQDDSHDVRLVRLNGPFFSAGWDTIESV